MPRKPTAASEPTNEPDPDEVNLDELLLTASASAHRDPATAQIEARLASFGTLPHGKALLFRPSKGQTLRGLKTRITRAAIRAGLSWYYVADGRRRENPDEVFAYIRRATGEEWTKQLQARAKRPTKKTK